MPQTAGPQRFWTVGRLAMAAGAVAWLAVVLTLDGPGLTIDEPLDVRPGRTYVATLRARGWGFFDREGRRLGLRRQRRASPPGALAAGAGLDPGRALRGPPARRPRPGRALRRGGEAGPRLGLRGPGRPGRARLGEALWARGRGGRGLRAGGDAPRLRACPPRGARHLPLPLLDARAAPRRACPGAPSAGPGHGGGGGRLGTGPADQDPRLVLAADPARRGPSPGSARARPSRPSSRGPRPASSLYVLGWPWLWYDLAGRLTRYLGTGVVRVPIRVAVLRPGLRRPRRPLALSLVLLRGHGPGRAAPARRLGPGPRLA